MIKHAIIIKKLALQLAEVLSPCGVTAADVASLAAALDAFVEVIDNPALAIENRTNDTKKVAQSIVEIRTFLLEKLDLTMRSMEVSNKRIYDLYCLARAIDRK